MEQIRDGENGMIIKSSEKDIYKAIKKLVTNKDLRTIFTNNIKKEYINTSSEIH